MCMSLLVWQQHGLAWPCVSMASMDELCAVKDCVHTVQNKLKYTQRRSKTNSLEVGDINVLLS